MGLIWVIEYTVWPYSRCAPFKKVLALLAHFHFLNFRGKLLKKDPITFFKFNTFGNSLIVLSEAGIV